MMARLAEEDLRRQIRDSDPKLSDDKITEVIAYIRKELAADPLALIQPLATGKDRGQLMVMRGVNFELALFLAQLTGAAIYSDQRLTREDLAAARLPTADGSADADLPAARGPDEPTGKYEDTVFEIDARLLVPPNGYSLTAVRRFLVAFGRRRHLGSVPFAILFGRAASAGSG